MTDLEINSACAEAMGLHILRQATALGSKIAAPEVSEDGTGRCAYTYSPLSNDAQAMALVKKFGLTILRDRNGWRAVFAFSGSDNLTDLNRAICECVAKMQKGQK